MHWRKTSLCILMSLLVLCGCSTVSNSNQLDPIGEEEYAAIQPYESSDARIKHAALMGDTEARFRMEQGLMDLSKTYFSPTKVAYKTQEFLDYDELDATDGSRGLLGTNRDENPNGLNPSPDEGFNTGNGTVSGAVILVDLYELDWYADDELQGISIAMVVNDALEDENGKTVEITKSRMQNYLEVTSGHLVSYMRERFNSITSNVPIYVACFSLDNASDTLGSYIYQGYFEGAQGDFSELDLTWVEVPGAAFSEADSDMAAQFAEYQNELSHVLVDYSYLVGKATLQDGKVIQLNITLIAHGKTASEILAITQAASEQMVVFTNSSCTYKVEVITDAGTYAIVSKNAGSEDVNVMTMQ